tara:strand:+ start:451 stop:1779 length:1329 start_codon:yes stop_codon:yes gene_type:complete
MIVQSEKFFNYLILLIPLFLITGPAIPDILITAAVLFGIFYFFYFKKYKNIIRENLFRVTLIFWLSLIFISLFSFNKINSFQDSLIFIRFLLLPIFCYFLFFKDKKIFEISLLIIFLLVVFVSLDTIYQFINYTSEDGFKEDLLGFKSTWYGRLTGPFGDELIPGSYLSKFGLLGFVFLLFSSRFHNKIIIHSIYLSLIILVTFVSGERMAFATFSMGLFILLLFLDGFRKSIFLGIVLGTILIFSAIYFHPFYNDFKVIESTEYHQGKKIEKYFKCKNEPNKICTKIINVQPSFFEVIKNFRSSAYGEIYLLSVNMFLDNPLTGVGINNFKYMCNNNDLYKKMMKYFNCASHPHNIYIQWLAEGGLIVFITFLAYLFFIISSIVYNNGEKKYKVISLVIMLTMFWPIMSTGSLIKNWYGVTTFFIIGMCLCLSKLRKNFLN